MHLIFEIIITIFLPSLFSLQTQIPIFAVFQKTGSLLWASVNTFDDNVEVESKKRLGGQSGCHSILCSNSPPC